MISIQTIASYTLMQTLSLLLSRQFIFDDKQHFFKAMSMFIWSLTKFPGLSKINDLTRKINQQPTPSHGIQAGARRSRVKFYQIIGIQRWGIFCVFPCLDSQLYMVEGEALQWIVIENIEQRSTLRSLNLPKLPQTWLGIEWLSCFWNWILISGHVFVQILFSIKQNFKTYSDNADAHESWLKVCQSFSWVLSLTKSFLSPSAARLLRGKDYDGADPAAMCPHICLAAC